MDYFTRSLLLIAFNFCIIANAAKMWKRDVDEDCDCGTSMVPIEDIYIPTPTNGDRGEYRAKFPWMVALEYRGKLHCSGALITRSFVLTVGHCVHGIEVPADQQCPEPMKQIHPGHCLDVKDFKIFVVSKDGVLRNFYPIRDVIMNPNYKVIHSDEGVYSLNDIALVRLPGPLICREYRKPICLPYPTAVYSYIEPNRTTIINAWADVRAGKPIDLILGTKPALLSGVLQIQTPDICIENFPVKNNGTSFCASGENESACNGDSGAPLVTDSDGRLYVIGVVADINSTECRVEDPRYFTPVNIYMDWILENVVCCP